MAKSVKNKVTFGTLCTCVVRYVIVIIYTDNTIKYVTSVRYSPHKECRWDVGKKAYFFDDKKQAEDICFGLSANGTGAFVMEVPNYFDEENFVNLKEKEA